MYNNLILNAKEKIDIEDLNNLERRFQFKFPQEIKEHFLIYNGGYPEKDAFIDENGDMYRVSYFFPIKNEKKQTLGKILELIGDDENIIPSWLIPFADDQGGNLFCFSVREADNGAIYFYNHEFEYGENPEDYITYLAKSLKVFINSLVE